MSSEISTKKTSIFDGMGSSLAVTGVMTGGFGSVSSVKKHGGIKKAIEATKANNKMLEEYAEVLKNGGNDVFTRNIKTAYNYQEYTKLAKQKGLLERKALANKLPLGERIKNLFRRDKLTLENYNKTFADKLEAYKNGTFDPSVAKLKEGKSISSEVTRNSATRLLNKAEAIKDKGKLPFIEKVKNVFRKDKITVDDCVAKLNAKASTKCTTDALENATTFVKSTKGLFKSELKDPFGLFFAGTEVVTRFTNEALPAFKNEGVVAGLKETFKALGAGVATWITDAGFSVVLRSIGATVGSIAGPVGMAIGSTIGNMVGGMLSSKLIQKLFPSNKTEQTAQQVTEQQPAQQTVQENSNATTQTEEKTQELTKEQIAAKYANMPSRYEIKQAAYAQAFQGKGGRFNTYYA